MATHHRFYSHGSALSGSLVKVAHLINDHSPLDVRVFEKECRSLVKSGYEVHVVCQSSPAERIDGVTFHSVVQRARGKSLWVRLANRAAKIGSTFSVARAVKADIYHVHEPLLIPVGLALKAVGAKLIYDAHEDFGEVGRRSVASEPFVGRLRLALYLTLEAAVRKWGDAIVAATPAIAKRFPEGKTSVVRNYPITTSRRITSRPPYAQRPMDVAYVGGLSSIRGVREMVRAAICLPSNVLSHLVIAGMFNSARFEEEMREEAGWNRVRYLGWISHEDVEDLLSRVRVGLITLHPSPNHTESLPVKLFEYMNAGIPVVASDFPQWRDIIDGCRCGLLVNPMNVGEIAAAISWLLQNPAEAEAMGHRGRQAIRSKYNWDSEVPALLRSYRHVAA